MGLPRNEAEQIARNIKKQFGGWGFTTKIVTSENNVIVTCEDEDGGMGFGSRFKEFTDLTKGWSVSFRIYEGKPAVIIW